MKRFLYVALVTAACGTDVRNEDELELAIDEPDHVAGEFRQDDATLVFDMSRDTTRDERLVYLETGDGEHLMTSVRAGGVETINILDGRMSISGPVRGEKVMRGDASALPELMERTEMKLFPQLRLRLNTDGYDYELSAISL